ncbi:MAG: prepilin peptidase, partial [Arenicellales bacterium WSBS_2016_MAG_OTU3]
MISLLQTSPLFLGIAAFVFGLLVGSFLNVVIHRLPLMLEHNLAGQCRELLELENDSADKAPNLFTPG